MRAPGLVTLLLFALPWAGLAQAEPAGTLEVTRTSRAESCPDSSALAGRVAELEPGASLVAAPKGGAAVHFDVSLDRQDESWQARIRLSGARRGDRTLTDSGESCSGLAEAVALTLAMLIEPGAAEPPARREPAPPAEPPSAIDTPRSRTPAAPSAAPTAGFELALRAGPALAIGLLDRPGLAVWGDVELGLTASFRTSLGVLWAPAQSIEHGPGQVDVSLLALVLSACHDVIGDAALGLALCAVQASGQIRGSGRDYSAYTDSVGRPWVALGAAVRARGSLAGPLGWSAGVVGLAPLTRENFAIEGVSGVAYEPSPLAVVAEAGLRLSIW